MQALEMEQVFGDLIVVGVGGYGAIASVDDDAPGGTSTY
jgi:hypothetical protein